MPNYYKFHFKEDSISHHGILGQKWGVENGPPYPLNDKDHSAREKRAGWKRSLNKNGSKSKKSTKKKTTYSPSKNSYKKSGKSNQGNVIVSDILKTAGEFTLKNIAPIAATMVAGKVINNILNDAARYDPVSGIILKDPIASTLPSNKTRGVRNLETAIKFKELYKYRNL